MSRRAPAIALLLLLLAPLGVPPASSQTPVVDFVRIDAQPTVLPPTGGALRVAVTATAEADAALVTFELAPQGGGTPRTTPSYELTEVQPGVLAATVDIAIPDGLATGWWSLRVRSVTAIIDERETVARAGGTASDVVLIHPDRPVAGLPGAPWPQTGGDAQHSGRTLAVGPPGVEVVRWRYVSTDRQPFHSPLVLDDGRVAALTWGGQLHVLDAQGRPTTPTPFGAGSATPVAPALGDDGNVIVAADNGFVFAVRPTGTVAWRHELNDGSTIARPLSPPVVAPNGDVLLVHEPWALTRLSSNGAHLHTVDLTAPDGLIVPVSRPPAPSEGPAVAVTTAGDALVVTGNELSIIGKDGGLVAAIACSCTPRGVSIVPELDVALVSAVEEVVALSLTTLDRLWSTRERIPALQGQVWQAPMVDWQGVAYIPTEAGRVHAIKVTTEGSHVWTRSLGQPIRGALIVDGEGNLFFADACRLLRSWQANAASRWTFEVDAPSCNGLATSLVLDRSGALLWASPDGALTVLGSNRLPTASFVHRWDGDAYVFDATTSTDPDGSPLTYAWDLGDGVTANGAVVRHRFASSGPATVTLTVSDGTGSSTNTLTLDVNFAPTPVVVDRSEGFDLLLDGSSTVDPEGDPMTFRWTLDGADAGNGTGLALNATEPHVYRARLTASDGTHEASQDVTLLAPARSEWSGLTLALFPGSCPSGVCLSPDRLSVIEGSLLEVRLINGAGRRLDVTTELPPVPGGVASSTVEAGAQGILHLEVGQPGTARIEVRPAGGGQASTSLTITIRPAPAPVTWSIDPVTDPITEGRVTDLVFQLQGPAPPGDATVRLAIRLGLEDQATKRVTFPAGRPVAATVDLPFTPSTIGPLEVQAVVESLNPEHLVLAPADGAATSWSVLVEEPSLLSALGAFATANSTVVAAFLVAIPAALIGALVYRRRAKGKARKRGDTTHPVIADGDATVAGNFIPRKFDRFHIERTLGEGGFGTTYLAKDTVLEREVVLKEVRHVGPGRSRDLLLHEARTAANLSHPNVVTVHDVVEEEGRMLLVMEYVRGGTLTERLTDGPLAEKEALTIITDVLSGLAALHGEGIVHRDVKPSNILITRDGVAKLTDFGVAAREDSSDGTTDAFVGTPRYMAPEQLAGQPPGTAADIYAAGALFYEMLTGKHHLGVGVSATPQASDLLLLRSNLPVPELGTTVNSVLAQALQRDPAKRFESADRFLDILRRLR